MSFQQLEVNLLKICQLQLIGQATPTYAITVTQLTESSYKQLRVGGD